MTWLYSTLLRSKRGCSGHQFTVPWQLGLSPAGLRHKTTQVVPPTTICHLSSSPSVESANTQLAEVKATSETQDVKVMDTLLKAVRKST